MENHPIPQDVTGFKFRLIGSITLKQFLYLLGAGAIALVFYLLPISMFLKIPCMIFAGGIGMAFAFVPIDGRPMDKMIMNFAKTIPAENQFIYHKRGVDMIFFSFTPPAHARLTQSQVLNEEASKKAQMFTQFSKTYFKPDRQEQENIQAISTLFNEGAVPSQGFTNRVFNADTPPTSAVNPIAPEEIKTIPESMAKPHMPPVITPPVETPQPKPALPPVQSETPAAPIANQQTAPATTLPFQPTQTTAQAKSGIYTANVLQGTVKDPRGKPLPHIVIEVLDKNNIPVRAFRTIQSGTFASVTPLPNGTYTIHLEDSLKKQNFSDMQIELKGEIMNPIEISSSDKREELRRELFGGNIG